jgi:hypothetical protein
MVLKRYHPDDYEEIDRVMQEANLAASTYVRFIKMQGEFSQWIGRVMGNEISSFIPRIYRLSRLQDEVDEEENALLEEMSIGRSVASFQPSDGKPEHPLAEDNTVPEETGTEQVSRLEQVEEDFAKDLHPLDPISTLVERAEKEGKEVIIPTKLLLDQSVLNGFEIFPYDQEDVPSTSPIVEANYPYEALEYRYHGVAETEAKQTLVEKVLCPYLDNHFAEVKPVLKWHFAAKPYQELTVLCGAPSQLKVAIKELGLVIAVPPRKREHETQENSRMDPVYALPKIPTRSVLQIELRENMDPEVLIEQLNDHFESLSPGQEVTIEDKWELMPNLAEMPLGSEQKLKTIRVQVHSSFEMEAFFAIRKEDSQESSKIWGALQATRADLLCSYPSSWVEVAIFPEVLPEHNLRNMTSFIDSLPRNSNMPGQYVIVWSDHYRYAGSVKCATMYAPKDLVPGLQAVLERNSPIKYKGMEILPIVSSEKTEVSYYQDVFQKHSAATQNKQVLKVSGISQWLKLESL